MLLDAVLGLRDYLLMPRLLHDMADRFDNLSYLPIAEADVPWLDLEKLAFYEREFAALGFEPRGDWTTPPIKGVQGFMRLMGHEGERAHVSLHSTKPVSKPAQPMKCAIVMALSDGWTVAASDREADPILAQIRPPRAVSLRDCDATPADLWQETRRIREQLKRDLQLQPIRDASAEAFFQNSAATSAERARVARRKNPLIFTIRRRALMRKPLPRRELVTGEWKNASASTAPIASPNS